MPELLHGQTLNWASYDPGGVVTAALQTMLTDHLTGQPVRLHLQRVPSAHQMQQTLASHAIGLAFWNLADSTELPAVCKSIATARSRPNCPVVVCFVESSQRDWLSLLVEAGAQVVVSQLPSLQRALPRIVARVDLSPHGFHPLTSGLVERLPWADD